MDLHTHLLMKEGMGFFISGSPDQPIRARDWRSRLSTKASFDNLDQTNLSVAVISLYAHPWLAGESLSESLDLQLKTLEEWLVKHPQWVIASSAADARSVLTQGKRVMVLSVEGAYQIFDRESQTRHWIDEKKIRIVTPIHLTTDDLGSPALYKGVGIVNTPIAWLRSLISGEQDGAGVYVNLGGLTPKGRQVADTLIQKGVWIDLSHASDRAQRELYYRMKVAGQPALYTHTVLRKYHGSERGVSDDQLDWVKESGGVLGLIPSVDLVSISRGKPLDCSEGFGALRTHWLAASLAVDETAVMLGSDFNAPLRGLPPLCLEGAEKREFGESGFHRADQLGLLFRSLQMTPEALAQKTRRFLEAWEKVRPAL